MKTETKITREQLRTILMGVENPTFVSLVSKTPVRMNKHSDYQIIVDGKKKKNPNSILNPFFNDGIIKLSKKYKLISGFDYVNAVNNRKVSEGKEPLFEAKENWFIKLSKGLVTDKKTQSKFYFRYQYLDDSTIETMYLYCENPIEKKLFESFLVAKSNYENQGLDNPLKFQVCDLENIVRISMQNNVYVLE